MSKLVMTTATATPVAPKGRPPTTATTWTTSVTIPQLRIESDKKDEGWIWRLP